MAIFTSLWLGLDRAKTTLRQHLASIPRSTVLIGLILVTSLPLSYYLGYLNGHTQGQKLGYYLAYQNYRTNQPDSTWRQLGQLIRILSGIL